MPLRRHICAIAVFWLITSAWCFNRDIWPWVRPGQPPPIIVDLDDEARSQETHGSGGEIRWTVYQNDTQKGYAKSGIRYNKDDDTYALKCQFKLWLSGVQAGSANWVMESVYRVSREGELRGITAEGTITFQKIEIVANLEGQVVGKMFKAHAKIVSPFGTIDHDLQPVEVSTRGSVLNPLQPFNRLRSVRKGQQWRMPLVDPLADALRAAAKSGGLPIADPEVRILQAHVLPQTQMLSWGHHGTMKEVPCLVIEYQGDDIEARTWIRESDSLVIRQEVSQHGDTLSLVRDFIDK